MHPRWIACIILFISFESFSQPYYADSAQVSHSSDYLKKIYILTRNDYAPLFKGLMHYPYPLSIEGTPYWNPNWLKGNIVFEDDYYENVMMKYDLVKDIVIVMSAEQGRTPLELFSPRVKQFYFTDLKFIYLDKNNSFSLKEGFYQELANGKLIALSKTQKNIQETIVSNQIEKRFDQIKKYYIINGNKSSVINKKNDLLDAIKTHKKEVLAHLKQLNLNFKINKEETITAAVEFYNKMEEKNNE